MSTIYLFIAFSYVFSTITVEHQEADNILNALADTNLIYVTPGGLHEHFTAFAGFDTTSKSDVSLILTARVENDDNIIKDLRIEYLKNENGVWIFSFLTCKVNIIKTAAENFFTNTLGTPIYNSEEGAVSWNYGNAYCLAINCTVDAHECTIEINFNEDYD